MSTRRTFLKTVSAGTLLVGTAGTALARGNKGGAAGADLFAPLTSGETVPKVQSNASGMATFVENEDGSVDYTVTLKNIEDVTQAHVHVGERGSTGGVVIFLIQFTSTPAGGSGTPQSGTPQDPIVVSGTIPAADAAPVLADPAGYYVNVHTLANTGGEVRGQIRTK